MLRYRVLLIDTSRKYERPVQALFMHPHQIDDWAKKTLAGAGEHAYVVIYRVEEKELGTIKKGDYDEGAVGRLQSALEEAGKQTA